MRRQTIEFAIALGLAVVVGCGAKKQDRSLEEMYLETIMPDDLVAIANVDVATAESIAIVDDPRGRCLGLRIAPDQPKLHGGVRAEVSVDFPFTENDRVRYAWRFKFADDFISDDPQNRWWVIGQWHDQPDARQNETWETFESRSPPIALGIGDVDGQLSVGMTYGVTKDNQPQFVSAPVPIQRGDWIAVEALVHWSQGAEGRAEFFIDGSAEPSMVATGPNMNNGYQHYLKIGMYRHPDIETQNWIYIDDVSIVQADDAVEAQRSPEASGSGI
ncbi:polysaccharide lyase [Rosistilla oblonga]|uniref:polysaccharide lyase n=1 Tax=Rosistilla oblonga TaxID=2527990 RepID=UPI003A978564